MIAGGLIWLVSENDAKLPTFGSGKAAKEPKRDPADQSHRDYISHMERVERGADEDAVAYQRRRDQARANYFMIERGHEEDECGFRKRLDEATESFRRKRHDWAESTRQAGSSLRDGARQGAGQASRLYDENPMIGGLLAAAAGAAVGAALPLSRTEEGKLGSIGASAREAVGEQKDQLLSVARDKKDELVAKAEEAAQPQTTPDDGAPTDRQLAETAAPPT